VLNDSTSSTSTTASSSSSRHDRKSSHLKKRKSSKSVDRSSSVAAVTEPATPATATLAAEQSLTCQLGLLESGDTSDFPFAFKPKRNCQYSLPVNTPLPDRSKRKVVVEPFSLAAYDIELDNNKGDPRFQYYLASSGFPKNKCYGFTRRRIGRGGR
jgi:hypothetical protein